MNSEGSDTEDHNKENEESSSMEEEHNNEIIKKHRLFKMCIVNSYGSSDVHPIKDDDKPIKLTSEYNLLARSLICYLLSLHDE